MSKKILIIPYSHQLGSTHTLIQIGVYLRTAGYDVYFAGEGHCLEFAKLEGFPVYHLSEIPYEKYREQTDQANLDYLSYPEVQKFVTEEVELCKKLNIELIVDTLRPTTYISCKILNIKRIPLTYCVLTRYFPFPLEIPESHFLDATRKFPALHTFLGTIAKSVVRENVYRKCASVYKKYMSDNAIAYPGNITYEDLVSKGDSTFIYDIKEFYPMDNQPENYIYTGALLYKLKTRRISWLKEVRDRKVKEKAKVIYLSMGSSGFIYPQIMNFLNEFTKIHKNILVVSNSTNHEPGKEIDSKNIYQTDYAAADDLLPLADLVISHGGKGTIYHCLKYGVPFIGIPHQAEQEWNLHRAETLQVGLICSKKYFSTKLLGEKLEYLLANYTEYQMHAKKFIDYIGSYNSERIIIDTVNKTFK